MQKKYMSLIETITSTLTGFFISLALVHLVLPFYGFDVKLRQGVGIVLLFTLASILRGYVIRRIFNLLEAKRDKFYNRNTRI